MPNFTGRTGSGRRSGNVTVIEEPVRRSATRNAKIIAIVTWITVALLSATILASRYEPIAALLGGVLIGLAAAFLAAVFTLAWPVVRALWWWSAEITFALALTFGWVGLSDHATLPYRVAVIIAIGVIPAAVPVIRRRVVAVAWCAITRHRIRTCFSEFIITNRTGSLPLILWTRPTPVGERVWVWLRPGLSLGDIQDRLDLIAVACWASAATAEPASDTNSARIRLDIKRRDALGGTLTSPLLDLVTHPGDQTERETGPVPTALDLPDVPAADIVPAPRAGRRESRQPASPVLPPAPAPASLSDVEDWI